MLLGPLGTTWGLTRPVLGQLAAELYTNVEVFRPIWDSKNVQWSVLEAYFVLFISWSPKIAQNLFCIQNLRMDLIFQEKKRIWKSNAWLPRYLQNNPWTIFLETPCGLTKALLKGVFSLGGEFRSPCSGNWYAIGNRGKGEWFRKCMWLIEWLTALFIKRVTDKIKKRKNPTPPQM